MDLEVKAELYRIIDQVNRRCLDGNESNSQLFVAEEDKDKLGRNEYKFPMPKNNRTNWYKAMRFLELNGVLDFWVTDADNIGVKMDFTPEEAEEELYCTVDYFYRPKFVEFCDKYKIDLSTPIQLVHSTRLILNPKDNSLIVDVDDTERLFFGRLRKGMALNMLRIGQMATNGRDKILDKTELCRLYSIKDFKDKIFVVPPSFNVSSFSEFFKGKILKNVVSKIINVQPTWVSIPEAKDIDEPTYLSIRELAKRVERK